MRRGALSGCNGRGDSLKKFSPPQWPIASLTLNSLCYTYEWPIRIRNESNNSWVDMIDWVSATLNEIPPTVSAPI
jgi:hypothetical protein